MEQGGQDMGDGLVSILAVCVTLIIGMGGLIANTLIQRKSNSIKIITVTRLRRRDYTQKLVSRIMLLSDEFFIKTLDDQHKKKAIQSMASSVSQLRTLYFFAFQKDMEFIQASYNVEEALGKRLIEGVDNHIELAECRKRFSKLADLYLGTEWKRIKLETVGKMGGSGAKSLPSWNRIFQENEGSFRDEEYEKLFR
nr:hypothetical protein [uncultured Sphaerochaeta sp.]